ncbi:unnamed protein product [Ixodes persulcatus]
MSEFDDLLKKAKCVYKGDPLASVIARAVRMLVQEEDQRTKKAALVSEEKASEDASLVLCDTAALSRIINAVRDHTRRCPEDLGVVNVTPWGFAARVECKCLKHTLVFDTSTSVGEIRVVDCFIAVAFVCSGMLGTQFEKFCNFSAIPYSRRSLEKLATHVGAAVEILKMNSLAAAQQEEARATEQRDSSLTSLRGIETDARHACRKNSFHTDVVALGQKHHKVVGIVHVTKKEEPSSQKHEALGTRRLYEYFRERNITVNDHSHDRNTTVNKLIREQNGPTNSNDRWHAAKGTLKGMKAIAFGPQKNEGRTWHVELSDKCKLVRNHAYFAMATCEGSATKLRTTLLNCVDHFCGRHENCVEDSPCKTTGHVPSALLIKDPVAEKLLSSFLRSTTIFKNAEDYIQAKDTHYVESFNNAMLIYLDKRIHYFDNSYNLRQSLAVLDWNEHVGRQCTSTYIVEDSRHPDRQGGKKKYSKKTFSFIQEIRRLILETAALDETKTSQATDEPIRENGS